MEELRGEPSWFIDSHYKFDCHRNCIVRMPEELVLFSTRLQENFVSIDLEVKSILGYSHPWGKDHFYFSFTLQRSDRQGDRLERDAYTTDVNLIVEFFDKHVNLFIEGHVGEEDARCHFRTISLRLKKVITYHKQWLVEEEKLRKRIYLSKRQR